MIMIIIVTHKTQSPRNLGWKLTRGREQTWRNIYV